MTKINLRYDLDSTKRLWLLNEGFLVIHEAIREGCERIYSLSCALKIGTDDNIRYYDVKNPLVNFELYETDTYPNNGYESIFFYAHDNIPGPVGNLGALGNDDEFERMISLHCGVIVPNQDHGKNNVSQMRPPRQRPSMFHEHWGFRVYHIYRGGRPTQDFRYSLDSGDLSGGGPNVNGLLRAIGVQPVTDQLLKTIPGYTNLSRMNGDITTEYCAHYNQEYDERSKRWRGFVNLKVKSGWFSSEWQKAYLE